MQYFKRIEHDIDTQTMLAEIKAAIREDHLPSDFDLARKKIAFQQYKDLPHQDSGWWYLTGPYSLSTQPDQKKCNDNSKFVHKKDTCINFPKTLQYLQAIAWSNNSYLQRAAFVLLVPGGEVLPHYDTGEYYKPRNRYHLVLQSKTGSEFTCGNEVQILKESELWWFDNKKIHSVKNLNTTPRIHLIFDLLPKNYYSLGVTIRLWIVGKFFQLYCDSFGTTEFNTLLNRLPQLKNILLSK